MDLSEIYFPVEKISNPSLQDGVELPSGLQFAVQVTKPSGEKRIVNYCSEIYHLVPNQEIIPLFLDQLSRYYKVDVKVRFNEWARFFVDLVIKDKSIDMGRGDNIFPKIRLINSYDGSYRYQYVAGIWRQICSNGMGIWEQKGTRIHKMHTPAIGEEVSFEKVMEMTSTFLAEIGEHTEVYRELSDTEIKYPESRIEEVIEETSFPSSLQEDVLYRLEEERNQLRMERITDWLVYNAFNYQLNHNEDLKAKENKKEKMDQEVLNYLLTY